MNNLDTKVARVLLFVISFAVIFKLVEFLFGIFLPEFATMYPLGVYAISAAAALVGALVPLQHFFPQA